MGPTATASTAARTATFSRPMYMRAVQLEDGDMLNMAADVAYGHIWQQIEGVDLIACADDRDEDDRDDPCQGTCVAVLSLVVTEASDFGTLHIQPGNDMVWARMVADADEAAVAAESEATFDAYAQRHGTPDTDAQGGE